MDGCMEIHPCVLQDIGRLGPVPKKHRSMASFCPSYHLTPTYTHIGATGTADHLTLLRLFFFHDRPFNNQVEKERVGRVILSKKSYTHFKE